MKHASHLCHQNVKGIIIPHLIVNHVIHLSQKIVVLWFNIFRQSQCTVIKWQHMMWNYKPGVPEKTNNSVMSFGVFILKQWQTCQSFTVQRTPFTSLSVLGIGQVSIFYRPVHTSWVIWSVLCHLSGHSQNINPGAHYLGWTALLQYWMHDWWQLGTLKHYKMSKLLMAF